MDAKRSREEQLRFCRRLHFGWVSSGKPGDRHRHLSRHREPRAGMCCLRLISKISPERIYIFKWKFFWMNLMLKGPTANYTFEFLSFYIFKRKFIQANPELRGCQSTKHGNSFIVIFFNFTFNLIFKAWTILNYMHIIGSYSQNLQEINLHS